MTQVVYHCSDKYADLMLASIASVVKRSHGDVSIYIIHSFTLEVDTHVQRFLVNHDISYRLIEVNRELLNDFEVPESYYRLLNKSVTVNLYEWRKAHGLLSYDEVDFTHPAVFYFILHKYIIPGTGYVYLNCDTIVTTDINNLMRLPAEQNKSCMMRLDWSEPVITREGKSYQHFNASVIRVIHNNNFSRYVDSAYESTLNNIKHAKFAMQHDFSIVAENNIQELDYYWNYAVKQAEHINPEEPLPYIIHYNTIITRPDVMKQRDIYNELQTICSEYNINISL